MDALDYYQDKKWCPACDGYVNYLMSVERSFCVQCGDEVRLFSKEDWETFHESMQAKKPKGGRPRKGAAGKAAAAKAAAAKPATGRKRESA